MTYMNELQYHRFNHPLSVWQLRAFSSDIAGKFVRGENSPRHNYVLYSNSQGTSKMISYSSWNRFRKGRAVPRQSAAAPGLRSTKLCWLLVLLEAKLPLPIVPHQHPT